VGTVAAVTLKQTGDAVSASNPEFQFSVLVDNFTDINGDVSALGTADCTWPVSGAIVRDTTP
jgi:hypothetical protein